MPGTYFLKQLQAIHPRQLKIADHQVRLKVIDDLERLLRAGLGIHNPAFGLKLFNKKLRQGPVILDKQYAGTRAHAMLSSSNRAMGLDRKSRRLNSSHVA